VSSHLLAGVAPPPGESSGLWILALFLAILAAVGVWACAGYVLALLSGWRALAEVYGLKGPFHGPFGDRLSLRVGRVTYWRCGAVGLDERSLCLSVWLFRTGHAKLLVPTSDIQAVRSDGRPCWLTLRLARRPGVRVELDAPHVLPFFLSRGISVDSEGRLQRTRVVKPSVEPLAETVNRLR
jgi:hypothetical protein